MIGSAISKRRSMIRQEVIRMYQNVKSDNILKMNATEIAGKYLQEYPYDPITKLKQDIQEYRVPRVLGPQIQIVIQAVLKNELKES